MAKDKKTLEVVEETGVSTETAQAKAPAKEKKAKKGGHKVSTKPSVWERFKKGCRELLSELKKVDWPPFKRTKNNPGVWANTGTVILVVLFFLVILTAFDAGLSALFRLLATGIGG